MIRSMGVSHIPKSKDSYEGGFSARRVTSRGEFLTARRVMNRRMMCSHTRKVIPGHLLCEERRVYRDKKHPTSFARVRQFEVACCCLFGIGLWPAQSPVLGLVAPFPFSSSFWIFLCPTTVLALMLGIAELALRGPALLGSVPTVLGAFSCEGCNISWPGFGCQLVILFEM